MVDSRRDMTGRAIHCELARRDFYHFCTLLVPSIYNDKHPHLKKIANTLQDFVNSDERILILNMPPRHGKTLTTTLFTAWLLGQDISNNIMTASYGLSLSKQLSTAVRDIIMTESPINERIIEGKFIFQDVFPQVKVAQGDASKERWRLEGNNRINYTATSPGGTSTGMGARYMIIDDIIKNSEEARNPIELEKIWDWFLNTMLSRLEGANSKILIIMTRWSTKDLTAKVLENVNYDIRHVVLPAYNRETDTMLCDAMLNRRDYEERKRLTLDGADIFEANYNQQPFDLEGSLYKNLRLYTFINEIYPNALFIKRWCYIDTADRGKDFLCAIVFDEYYDSETGDNFATIVDVLYTDKDMTFTESWVTDLLIENEVDHVRIESNASGINFARTLNSNLQKRTDVKKRVIIDDFYQKKNKEVRIFTNAPLVSKIVFFPTRWANEFPAFYQAIMSYSAEGRNKHDDAPDALTGVVETITEFGYALYGSNKQQYEALQLLFN